MGDKEAATATGVRLPFVGFMGFVDRLMGLCGGAATRFWNPANPTKGAKRLKVRDDSGARLRRGEPGTGRGRRGPFADGAARFGSRSPQIAVGPRVLSLRIAFMV